MGTKNPTRRELLEHNFPIRLLIESPAGQGDPVGRALRRVLGRQAWDRLGRALYLTSLRHASGFICACPDAQLVGEWPVRLTLVFEHSQTDLVRDALRRVVGDNGYGLDTARFYRGKAPAWHLDLKTVWDGVQFMRMGHPAVLSVGRWVSRGG